LRAPTGTVVFFFHHVLPAASSMRHHKVSGRSVFSSFQARSENSSAVRVRSVSRSK
jgi:hypothetical protein